ncbi:hypothetical protein chiPu_0029590, partial [Chiloscyllium punctatum]|nr:hypothetical protein [Chiloscyllium punctatum]
MVDKPGEGMPACVSRPLLLSLPPSERRADSGTPPAAPAETAAAAPITASPLRRCQGEPRRQPLHGQLVGGDRLLPLPGQPAPGAAPGLHRASRRQAGQKQLRR